ncbi:ribonuclease T2 family protein [Legionella sp. CNM-4043-24]|uniref:ribonuclease T2 family protein n=1 Tax=Legionella sp. CNM-4043-24 TaxID=3421646 RepID=UPI00403A9D72
MKLFSLVFFLFLSLPSFASVPVTGHILMTKSCPAWLSKNKKTNPNNVYTQTEKIYAIREVNNTSNPAWLRIWIPENPQYPLRWVQADCGAADYETSQTQSCQLSPGLADSYVLALSWQPGFCQTYGYDAGKPECLHLSAQSWQARHLVLHGLWPNQDSCGEHYGFCGVQSARSHCDYAPVNLSDKVAEQLRVLMPSYSYGSCLERHEWNKHGSCQIRSPDEYFALATRLTREADQTELAAYLRDHAGRQVTRSILRDKITQSFGADATRKVYLGCKNGLLVDVFVQLPALIPAESSLTELVNKAPEFTRYEGCPESIAISNFNN